MTFPSWKLIAAASAGIVSANYLGPKIGAKLVGPELDSKDATINNVKEYAAIVGVGLATFIGLVMVLRA